MEEGTPDIRRELVPGSGTSLCKKYVDQKTWFRQMGCERGDCQKKSEAVEKVYRCGGCQGDVQGQCQWQGRNRQTRELVLYSRMDRKPVQGFQEWCDIFISWVICTLTWWRYSGPSGVSCLNELHNTLLLFFLFFFTCTLLRWDINHNRHGGLLAKASAS